MVQRVYRQICKVDANAKVTIATSKSQVSAIHNQLGGAVGVSVEPCRRDTFPAIALATAYLHDVMGVGEDEAVVVCPVDPYVEDDYFVALKQLSDLAEKGRSNLTLMGVEPTYPSEKYGYIIPEGKEPVSVVRTFKEKPTEAVAKEYIAEGALWNGGVFAYKLGYVLNRAHELIDFTDYADLFSKYDTLTKISFDYAVVEHEKSIAVMRFKGQWKDLGTWNTLVEAMPEPTMGKVLLNEQCEDVHVINELNVPILCMGLKNVIVSASAEGILVSDTEQSDAIKPFVDAIDQPIMFSEKSWGDYRVLDSQLGSLTLRLNVREGAQMVCHSHDLRDEVWTVLSGEGVVTVDGKEQAVSQGDVVSIPAKAKHTIKAISPLSLLEVQMGGISVKDKKKY